MLFQKIFFFMALDKVFSYHFYNPTTHDILTKSSLDNIPTGYKLLPPPKGIRKRTRLQTGNKNGRCIDAGFTCSSPFDKSLTFQYECDNDYNCPKNYKCCSQKCFLHKICSKAFSSQTPGNGGSSHASSLQRPGNCAKWPYNCQKPYDYSLTSIFKCNYDRQCPKSFKCCQQSCFLHKICSRVVTDVGETSTENESEAITENESEVITENENEAITENESEVITENESEVVTENESEGISETESEAITENEIEYSSEKEPEEEEEEEEKVETTTENTNAYEYEDEDEDEEEVENNDEDEDHYFDEIEEEEEDNKQITHNSGINETSSSTPTVVEELRTNEEESTSTVAEHTTYGIVNFNTKVKYKSFDDKQSTNGMFRAKGKHVLGEKTTTPSIKTPDPNEIISEYAAYYYYYDT
ncbi:hypothetical protein NQ314_001048 [Rhamnusium bicolor]|uniref:WAP domain-containing protein n=1 Tax=Rhamnusium bicolor TaxID=1586634 RepID=A0AAV8ZTT3_9CUCU|nr:hypothetical protein NQ314_001048 [Rhamnusium bicolor]